jgi:hypothetical protein
VTAPRVPGSAELAHPPWCDVANCPLELVGAGLRHQSAGVEVRDDAGRLWGTVVLQQAAYGRLSVGLLSRSSPWPPHVARRLGEALLRAAELADAEQ